MSAPCRSTALHDASSNGHTEIVKALLEKGAAVNAANEDECVFPCCLCCMGDGCKLSAPFRLVVESVSAPCRHTALHLASRNGDMESVTALLEKGADVDAESGSGKTAFHIAKDRRAYVAAVEVRCVLTAVRSRAIQWAVPLA